MKLTKQNILDLNPCREGLDFVKQCDFDSVKIYNTCPRSDWLIWLLRRTNIITKPQAVTVAVMCAEHVLVEKKYPNNKRPRRAIDVAKTWLANPTEENRRACRAAASNAYAAAASNASAAASAAAYAASAAADSAAASNASNASDSASESASAAAAYRIKERQWQADKIREIIPCPFEN